MADTKITSINQVTSGAFVKFVGRDSQGRFTYIGQVINVFTGKEVELRRQEKVQQGAYFQMIGMDGTMGFSIERPDDNELYLTAKPAGWAKFMKNPKAFKADKLAASLPPQPTKTKKELVLDLVTTNSRKGDKALLKLAKKEIGGSEAQLKNYIKLAKLAKN